LENIIWTCGSEMVVQNTLFSWENNNDNQSPNSCNVCPTVSSKCHRFGNLTVFAPIVADFSISAACVSGQSFEVYTLQTKPREEPLHTPIIPGVLVQDQLQRHQRYQDQQLQVHLLLLTVVQVYEP